MIEDLTSWISPLVSKLFVGETNQMFCPNFLFSYSKIFQEYRSLNTYYGSNEQDTTATIKGLYLKLAGIEFENKEG